MKYPVILIFLFINTLINIQAQKGEIRYELIKEKSHVKWVSKDINKEYSGEMNIKEGYIVMKDGKLSQLVVFVNVQSLTLTNLPNEKERNEFAAFLKSPEFLNAGAMDYAVFKMYKCSELNDSKEGNYTVEGSLSIKGYSNDVSFPAAIEEKKDKISGNAKLSMNRVLWKLQNPAKANGGSYTMDQTLNLFIALEGSMAR